MYYLITKKLLFPSLSLSLLLIIGAALLFKTVVFAISPTSSLADDWSSGSTSSAKWSNGTGGHATVVSQQLNITTSGTNYYYIDTHGTNYNLVSSSVSNQLVNAGNQSLGSLEVYPVFIKSGSLGAYYLAFFVNNNTVHARKEINGANTEIHTGAYNATSEQYFRIREASGTTYWETSPDGSTWTIFTSVADTSLFDLTTVYIGQLTGIYSNESSATTAIFDNFNILPGGVTPTSTPTPTIAPSPTPIPTVAPTPTSVPSPTPTATPTPTVTPTPNPDRPDHTIVVMEENHSLQEVLGTAYFTQLANEGAIMVNSFAVGHPSEPNYFAIFSGSTQGAIDDSCLPTGYPLPGDNLANQLTTTGFSFRGYSENLPTLPITNANCEASPFAGHHNPWLFFSNISNSAKLDFTQFPTDFTTLPTVAFVTPNNNDNAHDGTVTQAATWLQTNIESYRSWAMTHNSLLIVQFDEDDNTGNNNLVYTVFVGPMVKPGIYNELMSHYNVLSTIENLYGLGQLNVATPITDIFK